MNGTSPDIPARVVHSGHCRWTELRELTGFLQFLDNPDIPAGTE